MSGSVLINKSCSSLKIAWDIHLSPKKLLFIAPYWGFFFLFLFSPPLCILPMRLLSPLCVLLLFLLISVFFRWVHPSLYEGVSVRPSVRPMDGWMDGPSVTCFLKCLKWKVFLIKILGADQLWHCWKYWMCWIWLKCPLTNSPGTHRPETNRPGICWY